MPDCENPIVSKRGTLNGKIAHICAASKSGQRYVTAMDNSQTVVSSTFFNVFLGLGNKAFETVPPKVAIDEALAS